MIDNPLPNQIMEQKDAEAQEQAYKEHCFSEAKEFYKAEEYHQKYIQKTGLHCAI